MTELTKLKSYVGALTVLAHKAGKKPPRLVKLETKAENPKEELTPEEENQFSRLTRLYKGEYELELSSGDTKTYTINDLLNKLRVHIGTMKLRKERAKRKIEKFTGILKPVKVKAEYLEAFKTIISDLPVRYNTSKALLGNLLSMSGDDITLTRQMFASILNVYLRNSSKKTKVKSNTYTVSKDGKIQRVGNGIVKYNAYLITEFLKDNFSDVFTTMADSNTARKELRLNEGLPKIHHNIDGVMYELNKKRVTKKVFTGDTISQKDYAGFVKNVVDKFDKEDVDFGIGSDSVALYKNIMTVAQATLTLETIAHSLDIKSGANDVPKRARSQKILSNLLLKLAEYIGGDIDFGVNYLAKRAKITSASGVRTVSALDVARSKSSTVDPFEPTFRILYSFDKVVTRKLAKEAKDDFEKVNPIPAQ